MTVARVHAATPLRPPAARAAPLLLGLFAIVGYLHVQAHAYVRPAPPASASAADAVPATTPGIATFYANDFDGRTMANGSTFHMDDPTVVASNTWPLGTRLLVRRIAGGPWDQTLSPAERELYFGRSVIVTVSDRGAFTHALDLSRGAFALLGRLDEGVIRVSIQPLGSSVAAAYR